MPPLGMVLGCLHHHQFLLGLTLANPSCPVTLISAPLGHPVPRGSPVSSWLQSGLWHPGLALHGLSSSHLAAPCPAGSCCRLPSLPPPGAAHGHPKWPSWGGSEWHKPSCDPLVNVAASRARAVAGPGCGSCGTASWGVQHHSWLLVACSGSALHAQCCSSTHLGEQGHPSTLSPSLGVASARQGVQAGQCQLSQ